MYLGNTGYDVATDKWTILCQSKSTGESWNDCVAIQISNSTKVYFIDTNESSDESKAINIYDIDHDTWSIGAAMPTKRVCTSIAVLNDVIYAIGGRAGQRGYINMMHVTNIVEAYFPIDYTSNNNLKNVNAIFNWLILIASLIAAIMIIAIFLLFHKKSEKASLIV